MKHIFSRYLLIVALFFLAFAFKTQAQKGPSNDSLYIVGSATPDAWSNPIHADKVAAQTFTTISPTEYKINVFLIGGNEYKFISQNGLWGNNWGIKTQDDPTEINGGPFTFNSNNIKAPAVTGTYTIDVNFAINIFTVKLASTPKVVISSFYPTSAATGDSVTIKGLDFTGATDVSFGGTPATYFSVLNDSTIKAVVGKAASGTIQVTAPDGNGILAGFNYNSNTLFIVGAATAGGWSNPITPADSAAQQFTTISPTEYKITIDLIGGKEYKFIPQDGSWTLSYGIAVTDDPTEVNGGALIANGNNILSPAVSGSYIIDVNFATNTFTVTPVVVSSVNVGSFNPTSADSGTTVTIKGSGFTGATSVSFGGTASASYNVVNDSTITAVVGGGTSGNVQVVSPSGTGALAGFTYTSTSKKGTLFIVGAATLGGWSNPITPSDSAAQQFTQISPTEFKITVPLIGGKEYKFIPLDGSWTLSYGISVQDDPSEINGGAFVTNGQNILAPATSGIYIIDVNFATNTFTVTPAPASSKITVTSFSPTSAAYGNTDTIKGSGFTGASYISFGGIPASSFVVLNDSTITAVVDTGASGPVKVASPKDTSSLGGFTYIPTKTNNSNGFIVGSAVAGGWANPIPIEDSAAQALTKVGPNELKITIHLKGGAEYKFIAQDGSWTQTYGIATQDDPTKIYGGAFVSNGQNILAPPLSGIYTIDVNTQASTFTVTLVSPDSLFIIGSATKNGWNNPLKVEDSAAQQFTQISPTEYKLSVSLYANQDYKFLARDNGDWTYNWGIKVNEDTSMVNSGKLLYGTNSQNILSPAINGTYTIDVNFATNSYTVILDSASTPTFTSFSPTTGDSGTVVTIKGSGFTGTVAVGFGALAATSFKVVNDSTITAVVSNGTSGSVIVVTPNGILSLDGFTYIISKNKLYLVGSATANGWNNPLQPADSAAQTFTPVSASVFTITTHLFADSSYKFLPTDNGDWSNSYGIAIANNPANVYGGNLIKTNSQNILAPALSGTYNIVVNLATNTFTTTLISPDSLYIVGNATANGWNNPLQAAYVAAQTFTQFSPTEYTLTVYLYADSSYKFIAKNNGSWTNNWGIAVSNDTTMVNGGSLVFGANSKNILAPSVSGLYFMDVDFANNVFYINSILPVKLASFNAAVSNKFVKMSWQTATELNVAHFSVQHSTDGSNFTSVGTVKAIGNGSNNYQFTDAQPTKGNNFYRLQIVDKNGTISYSKVVTVQFAENSNKIALYPTLVRDGIINVRINEATAGKATIRVIDLSGRVLQSNAVNITEGSNVIQHKITATSKGNYIVSVETVTDKQAFKVIVE